MLRNHFYVVTKLKQDYASEWQEKGEKRRNSVVQVMKHCLPADFDLFFRIYERIWPLNNGSGLDFDGVIARDVSENNKIMPGFNNVSTFYIYLPPPDLCPVQT